jgi:hypothetical protein
VVWVTGVKPERSDIHIESFVMAEDPPSATPRHRPGTSRAYILDRLKRENLTELAAAVESRTLSAFAAGVQCGWIKRSPTVAAVTHQARRRQVKLQGIVGELSPGQKMELIYGPGAQGSLFNSREALESAWAACRDELLERANPGRRPAIWWMLEATISYPGFGAERSVLWRMDLLSADERVALETEWKAAFREAQAPDFTVNDGSGELLKGDCARAAHYRWADIPSSLIKRWSAAARRRTRAQGAQSGASPAKAQEDALGVASSTEGKEEKTIGLRPDSNAVTGRLK